MKVLVSAFLICLWTELNSQIPDVSKFQIDLIHRQVMDYSGEIRIAESLDSNWIDYHLGVLTDTITTRLTFHTPQHHDSLTFTEQEKDSILLFFRNIKNLTFSDNTKRFQIVPANEISLHLQKDFENQVVFVSRPLFIREGTVAVAFFANFCCGGINGPAHLSLYREENAIWTRWIYLSAGEF